MKFIEYVTIAIIVLFVFLMTNNENLIVADQKNEIDAKQKLKEESERLINLRIERLKTAYIDDIPHDSNPNTNTYPVTLDASSSNDGDNDQLSYKWTQIDGPSLELSSNKEPIISFTALAGEYTFELIVTDTYGSKSQYIKTVKINEEPNKQPQAFFNVIKNKK